MDAFLPKVKRELSLYQSLFKEWFEHEQVKRLHIRYRITPVEMKLLQLSELLAQDIDTFIRSLKTHIKCLEIMQKVPTKVHYGASMTHT